MSRLRSAGLVISDAFPVRQFTANSKTDVLKAFQQDYAVFKQALETQFTVPPEQRPGRERQPSARYEPPAAKYEQPLVRAVQPVARHDYAIEQLHQRLRQDKLSLMNELGSLRLNLESLGQKLAQPPAPAPAYSPHQLSQHRPRHRSQPKLPVPHNKPPSRNSIMPQKISYSEEYFPQPVRRENAVQPQRKGKVYHLRKYVLAILFVLQLRRVFRAMVAARREEAKRGYRQRERAAFRDISGKLLESTSLFLNNFLDLGKVDLDCSLKKEDPEVGTFKLQYLFELMDALLVGVRSSCSLFSQETLRFARDYCAHGAVHPPRHFNRAELALLVFDLREGFLRADAQETKFLLLDLFLLRVLLVRVLAKPRQLEPALPPSPQFDSKAETIRSLLFYTVSCYIRERLFSTSSLDRTGMAKQKLRGNYQSVRPRVRPEPGEGQCLPGGEGVLPGQHFIPLRQYGGGRPFLRLLGLVDQFLDGMMIRLQIK